MDNPSQNNICQEIWEYKINENKWTKLKQTLPFPWIGFGYILTSDEQNIIMFGGIHVGIGTCDDIYVWNLETMRCRKSIVKCPEKSRCIAVLSHNNYDEKIYLMVHGYVRTN